MDHLYLLIDAMKNGYVNLENGGIVVTNHYYGGIKVVGNNGAFAVGENNTVNQQINNEPLNDLTKDLLQLLDDSRITDQKKEELKEIIVATEENVSAEMPNKTVIKSLLSNASAIIEAITKTPALITAYEKWETFIKSII
jgi:hypothetical protein